MYGRRVLDSVAEDPQKEHVPGLGGKKPEMEKHCWVNKGRKTLKAAFVPARKSRIRAGTGSGESRASKARGRQKWTSMPGSKETRDNCQDQRDIDERHRCAQGFLSLERKNEMGRGPQLRGQSNETRETEKEMKTAGKAEAEYANVGARTPIVNRQN